MFQVILSVSEHYRLASGARRGVNAADLFVRYCLKTERILIAKVVFGSERQLVNVVYRLDILRFYA